LFGHDEIGIRESTMNRRGVGNEQEESKNPSMSDRTGLKSGRHARDVPDHTPSNRHCPTQTSHPHAWRRYPLPLSDCPTRKKVSAQRPRAAYVPPGNRDPPFGIRCGGKRLPHTVDRDGGSGEAFIPGQMRRLYEGNQLRVIERKSPGRKENRERQDAPETPNASDTPPSCASLSQASRRSPPARS
jgi:hypothetical protein